MPLVLVENERTAGGRYDSWEDLTGICYHFPNAYRNLVRPGEPFVYYRGVRRTTGRRDSPEYFGCGIIGEVWQDIRTAEESAKWSRKYFCSITQFTPFSRPVPWMDFGKTFEEIPRNLFGNGVRRISTSVFQTILSRAGVILDDSTEATSFLATNASDETRIRSFLETPRNNEPAGRSRAAVSRIIRDSSLGRMLKELYSNTCQICHEYLPLPDGDRYSEAHHIRPLGYPHAGPDTLQNLLIVCPNDHALCDLGALVLDTGSLLVHPLHRIGLDHIHYHNKVIVASARARV